VTVIARELLLWPLLAILLGALAAYKGLVKNDKRRPSELLRASLKDSYALYRGVSVGASPEGHPYPFAKTTMFGESSPGDQSTDGSEANKLYASLADLKTQEALDDAVKAVQGVNAFATSMFNVRELWLALEAKAKDLPGASLMARSVEAMRVERSIDTPEAAAKVEADLRSLLEGVVLWLEAEAAYKRAAASYERAVGTQLSQPLIELLAANNPEGVYQAKLITAASKRDLEDGDVVDALRDRGALAEALASSGAVRQGGVTAEQVEALGGLMWARYSGQFNTLTSDRTGAPSVQVDRRTPTEIIAAVREQDWLAFLLGFAGAVIIAAVTKGADFGGTWTEYAALVLFGATGTTIAWKAHPWYRSYRAPKSTGS
jgi:hypothetical protein